jgi:rSAM/selenodomain-associated transferase 1
MQPSCEPMSDRDTTASRKRLIVFTRYPIAGQTKTRLIPALGAEGAARLQRLLTEHALRTLSPLMTSRAIELEVRYDERASRKQMLDWLAPDHEPPTSSPSAILRINERTERGAAATAVQARLTGQGPGDLGQRMHRAFVQASSSQLSAAVLVGIDTPDLEPEHIVHAFAALRTHDAVLGPATDGGYYLIGLLRPEPTLFDDMPWGSSRVLELTRQRLGEASKTVSLLGELSDVDRPEDLVLLSRFEHLREFAARDTTDAQS